MAISELQRIKNEVERLRNGQPTQGAVATPNVGLSAEKDGNRFLQGVGYVTEKLGAGALRSVEGITDFLVGGVADLVGADDFAENIMKNDWVNYNRADERYNPGKGMQFVGDVASGIGGMLPAIAVSLIPGVGQVASSAVFGVGAAGQSTAESVQETGELTGKEWLYGAGSGLLETGIEALSGGIGGTQAGKVIGKQFGKSTLGKVGATFLSEGLEEVASDIANPILKRATGVDSEATIDWGNLPRTFLVGGTTGAVMGGGRKVLDAAVSGGFNKAGAKEDVKTIAEYNAENNLNQAEGKTQGYSQEDIKAKEQSLSARLQKMDEPSRQAIIQRNKLGEVFNENGTIKEHKPAPDVYNEDSYSASLKGKESTLAFKPVAMGSKVAEVAKNAMNTLTKITQGKSNIVLTDDELVTENGKKANGLYKDGVIYLDANATDYDKVLTVGVHEVIHGLEGTKEYSKLADFIVKEISKDPALQQQYSYDKYRAAYDAILEGEWTEKAKDYQAVTEIFADFLGNKVTQNKTLLDNLANRDKNVIQKMIDWVRNAVSKLGETAEERAMRKDLKKLEKMLVEALEAGRGGISLEKIEERAKEAEKTRRMENGNVQSVKFGENKNANGKLATARYNVDTNVFEIGKDSELAQRIANSDKSKYTVIKEYLVEKFGNTTFTLSDGKKAIMDKRDAQELSHKADDKRTAELARLKDLVEQAKLISTVDNVEHNKFQGFSYYKIKVSYEGEQFEILINVGKAKNDGSYHIYSITNYNQKGFAGRASLGLSRPVGNAIKNESFDSIISQENDLSSENAKKVEKNSTSRKSIDVDFANQAKNYYGSTYNWKETGYILQDGTRLDLSGRNEGSRGGYRTVDHRDIFDINEDLDVYGTDAMNEFIAQGNIRVMPETPGINLQVEPNAEQYRLIQDFVERVGWKEGYFSVDIDNKNGDTIETLTYEGKPSGRKVVADLKYYFKEGKVPYKSNLSAFRYSIDVDNFDQIGYTEITLPAQERNRVQSEALKWSNKQDVPLKVSLANEYTYLCMLDEDGEIHIFRKEKTDNIHEDRSYYANQNKERLNKAVQGVRFERGINNANNRFDQNGRNQGTADTSDNRQVRPEGQSDGRGYRQDGVYADRTKERKGIVYYDSEGRYSLDTELDNKTTERVKTVVDDITMVERWKNAWENLKQGAPDQWIKAQIALTDEQAGIIQAGKNVGVVMHGEVQRARTAKASAINMLNNEQRDFSGKKRVGDSLKAIFKPIQSRGKKVAQDFNLYLLHQLNVDRMSAVERGLRDEVAPVFEEKVDKAFSLEKVQQLEKQYPEFKATAEKVWKYSQNLLQYRVDAGLITQEQADQMTKMYPHYVPAFYEKNGGGTSGAFVGQKGIAVKTGVKSAKGSTGVSDIKDVQASMAKQTVAVVRAASINKVVEKLYDGAVAKGDFTDVEEVGREKMTDPDVDYDKEIPKEKNVYFYKDGERITLAVTKYVDAGFRGLTAGAQLNDPLTTLSAKAISLFKKLVTSYNPLFAATNTLRDAQEALFYTKYPKKFFANYGKALVTRKSDPRLKELWEQYKAMGGTGSGYFSRETGVYDNRSKLKKNVEWFGDKMQIVNEWVEQAPRFAEFVASVEAGNSLEQALYDSAEVTTNFSRGGKTAKAFNRHLVPFLNPSIQGWSKMWRGWVAPMDGKSAAEIERLSKQSKGRRFLSNYGMLMFKAILCGVSIGLFNDMLYRWIDDDEDYENLPLNIKENYYLIKVGKKFIKIPKGRVVALYGSMWTRLSEAMNGNEDALDALDWAKSASEMVSPLESAFRSIIAPFRDAQTNTTWYGGQIESASMENLAPSERYDEGTSSIAIAIGKALNQSPKKIHYILDQYSGVVGDIILPRTTNKAEKDMFSARFIVDPLYNNDVSTKYYDMKEELTWAKNSGDVNAKLMLKYINQVQEDLAEMYQQKREVANDKTLSREEKVEQTDILQSLINGTLASSIESASDFEQLLIDSGFERATATLEGSKAYQKMDENARNSAYNKLVDYYYNACLSRANGAKLGTKYELYGTINATDIVMYLTNISNIEADKDKKGNTVQGSRKAKVQQYIEGLRLSADQKYILLYLAGYTPTDKGKSAISKYLMNNGYTQKELNDLWN